MRVADGMVHFSPYLPDAWGSIAFKVRFRKSVLLVKVTKTEVEVSNLSNETTSVVIYGEQKIVAANSTIAISK